MSGFINSDGSGLIGGLLPSGVGEALQLDSSGNLKIAGTISATNPSVASTGAAVPASATYIAGNKAGNLTGVSLDASGYLNVNVQTGGGSNASVGTDGAAIPTSSTLIGASDGTNLQQLLVESAANRNLRAALFNGANELAIDASGRLTSIMQAVAGTALAADVSNSELRASIYGKNAAAGDTPFLLDSSGRTQINIAQWNGAAPSAANPIIDEDRIRTYIRLGQGYSATTGKQTSGGAVQTGMAIFNNSTGKTFVIYSIRTGAATSGVETLYTTTADPAFSGVTVTSGNTLTSGGTASVATLEAQNTNITIGGSFTAVDAQYGLGNQGTEFLMNGAVIILPNGATTGVALSITTSTSVWMAAMKWIEI